MIYILLFVYLYISGILSWFTNKRNRDMLFNLAFIILLIIVCFRSVNVGIDTSKYADFFTNINGGYYGTVEAPNPSMEYGIVLLAKILRLIFLDSNNPYLYLFTIGILTLLPLYYFIKKHSYNPCFSLFIIFTVIQGSAIVIYVAAIRQAISMGVMLIAITYLIKNNRSKFYIYSFIAVLFHYTSILTFICIYIFERFKVNKSILYTSIISILIISLVYPQIGQDVFFKLLSILDSNLANLKYSYYMEDKSYEIYNRSILSAGLNLCLPTLCVYLCKKENVNNIFIKTLVFAPVLFLLFGSFEQISRLVFIYWIIGITGVIQKSMINKKSLMAIIIISSFFLLRAISAYVSINNNGITPYTFLWEIN